MGKKVCEGVNEPACVYCAYGLLGAESWHWRSRTLEDSDSRGEVVDTPGSAESGSDDRRRGDQIVGEAVVEVSLCVCQSAMPLLIRLDHHLPARSGDSGAHATDIPEARRRRSPSQTPSHTCRQDTHVSDTAPGKLHGAQWQPAVLRGQPSLMLHYLASPASCPPPTTDASYLAVNSSNVSSAWASLQRTADCEKARWAFQATGVAR